MEKIFRLFDFNIYTNNENNDDDTGSKVISTFMIQMFGIDEQGKTACILVENFKPFFYVMVDDTWDISKKNSFQNFIKEKMGKYHDGSITDCKIIKRKKLYGFDGGKEHKFIRIEFENVEAFNKAKGLWYGPYFTSSNGRSDRKLLKQVGLHYQIKKRLK